MIKRLRAKFVCINMALVVTMLVVILVTVYQFTAAGMEENSMETLRTAMNSPMLSGRPGAFTLPCFILQEEPNGNVLVLKGDYFDLSDEEMVADIYRLAKYQDADVGVLEEYALRFYREEGRLGARYAFTDISGERAALRNLLAGCVLIGLAAFLGFLAISILLARWAIRPVERAFEQQKQFVADASHELKTPLTVILTNAEMLRSEDYDRQQKSQFVDSILDVSQQMRQLVENLLQLARADRGQQKVELTRLDLSALTENALLPFEPVYFERGLQLESAIEPGIFVRGDPAALRQVIDILLDNGQKYGHGEAAAVLSLKTQGKKAVLRFFTPGQSMTPEQCADIFKRFYRLDEARTMSGSYGLGLSIAQSIVASHAGRIWAEGVTNGNAFCIIMPII